MTFAPLGDSAVVVTLGQSIEVSTLDRVRAIAAAVESARASGILDVVPAYTTVTVFYDPVAFTTGPASVYEHIVAFLRERIKAAERGWLGLIGANREPKPAAAKTVEIPVCYGGEFGPDLEEVARHCRLSVREVIAQHTAGKYVVQAIGFAPGFCYLGGLAPALHTPRRPTPRPAVAPGSVGIGWQHTGVYPAATPGGWQLIGRTPLTMFDVEREHPSLLAVGDHVNFGSIKPEEFTAWK